MTKAKLIKGISFWLAYVTSEEYMSGIPAHECRRWMAWEMWTCQVNLSSEARQEIIERCDAIVEYIKTEAT